MKTLVLMGRVFSGKGEGARFLRLTWVRTQLDEKLGFVPYSGTLNIKLAEESVELRSVLIKAKSIEIVPAKGFYRGRCFRAQLTGDVECAVVIPETPGYPEDVIEIVASANLREKFRLRNGDAVEVEIMLE